VEHYYGHQVRGHTAKKLPWRQAPGDESKKWPGAGVSMAIRRMGASDDPFRLAYGFAVRARAIEEALSVRGEEREDGVPTGRHIEEGSDEEGKSPLEISFEKAPESLKLHVPCMPSLPCPFRIFTVLDPLSEEAQHSPAVLKVLHEELNAEINIILAPRPLVASPLVQYYRVAQAAAAPPGGLGALGQWNSTLHGVRFSLPRRPGLLLSTLLHTPDAWMCSAVDSGEADLDSLRADKDGVVRARYALEAMFIEGWALNVSMRSEGYPAAGKHLALVPAGNMEKHEGMAGSGSVVVKSGYFQLRIPPGIYDLVSQGNDAGRIIFPKGQIALTELAGRGSSLRVHVASHDASTPSESVASSSASHVTTTSADYEGAGGDRSKCNETIHVFSVASGHRYERLLRIMMLSVRKHTDCPLHFWLIENFLSPHFRRLLPALAAKVGFAVSRVTYKWPAWVRTQTEKQRVIWAYKILFLDVLFPLQVQRILFIDADQIVRANVKELWDIDLKGRVYGFVPFCGSGPKEGWFGTGNTGDAKKSCDTWPSLLGARFLE
jgi:UDP-glucose:glycoprotein glucosyltransferase